MHNIVHAYIMVHRNDRNNYVL